MREIYRIRDWLAASEMELRRIRSADSARPGANGSGNSSTGNGKSSRNAP